MATAFTAAHLLVPGVLMTLFKQNILNGGLKQVTTVSHFLTFGAIKWVCCVLEYKTSEYSYSFSSTIKHFRITAYICLGYKIACFEETSLLCNSRPETRGGWLSGSPRVIEAGGGLHVRWGAASWQAFFYMWGTRCPSCLSNP